MPDARTLLEAELRSMARALDEQFGDRDLSLGVELRLTDPGRNPRVARRPSRRRLVPVLAAVVVAVCASTLAVPSARSALARFFDVGSVRVQEGPPNSTPTGGVDRSDLQLGERVPLATARDRFPLVVPSARGLGVPDEVWFEDAGGGGVALLYDARPGLPAADPIGIGLLIEEFAGDGRNIVQKYLTSESRAEPVTIGADRGVFLSGGDHYVFYGLPDGSDIYKEGRLAANTLIFERGRLTIRIEGDLPADRMVAIAASLR